MSARLQRELKKIRNDGDKEGFEMTMQGDNIRRWDVIFKISDEFQLGRDLQEKELEGVHFEVIFDEEFPREPPFMRIVSPVLDGRYISSKGSLCMEILTLSGWASAMDIISLFNSVRGLILAGGARVRRKGTMGTEMMARMEYINTATLHNWGAVVPKKRKEPEEKEPPPDPKKK